LLIKGLGGGAGSETCGDRSAPGLVRAHLYTHVWCVGGLGVRVKGMRSRGHM